MRNIQEFLTVIFRDLSAQDVLDEIDGTTFNHLNTALVINLMEQRVKNYSRTELELMLSYFARECSIMRECYAKGEPYPPAESILMDAEPQNRGPLNIFALVTMYGLNLLNLSKDQIRVKYEKLLHWKDLSLVLSEDVLVCAALAKKDKTDDSKHMRREFRWASVLGNDNEEITNMLAANGVSENHFHLKGSGPAFLLTWPYIMNSFAMHQGKDCKKMNNDELGFFKKMEEQSRNAAFHVSSKQIEIPLLQQVIQAAAIRHYLYCKINGIYENRYPIKNHKQQPVYTLENILSLCSQNKKPEDQELESKEIRRIRRDVYTETQSLRSSMMKKANLTDLYDYALVYRENEQFQKIDQADDYEGERQFLYHCFRAMTDESDDQGYKFTREDKTLFWMYLIIHERFRVEFLQVNREITGFENFDILERRKDVFLDNCGKGDELILRAFKESLSIPGMQKLEARIAPKNTVSELEKRIIKYDGQLEQLGDSCVDKVGYIIHFIKGNDDHLDTMRDEVLGRDGKQKTVSDFDIQYRNKQTREKVRLQADALKALREQSPETAKRIVGIDACNFELFCRPEVFAPAFKELRSHHADNVPDLQITYHVGEAFWDIASGLRAIDEAIRFFDLKAHDRLGHALAMGMNVEKWYEKKHHLMLPLQEHVDNLMWLYFMAGNKGGKAAKTEKVKLQEEFRRYFDRLYCGDKDVEKCIEGLATEEILSIYYRSWKMRSKDPEQYLQNAAVFYSPNHFAPDLKKKLDGKLFRSKPGMENDKALFFYLVYHFNNYSKLRGSEPVQVTVNKDYYRLIRSVQKAIQEKVRKRGISVETNPTSNYLIGSFNYYSLHPVLSWFNRHLAATSGELKNCLQLDVSINTDDAGVFGTRLDNEYALMCLALERVENEDGTPKYTRDSIMKWLDAIRSMGMEQSFLK